MKQGLIQAKTKRIDELTPPPLLAFVRDTTGYKEAITTQFKSLFLLRFFD